MDDLRDPPVSTEWSTAEAKSRLSEVLDRAEREGPQIITRNGKARAIVLSAEEWERSRPRGTLYKLMRQAPKGADFDFSAPPTLPKDGGFDVSD